MIKERIVIKRVIFLVAVTIITLFYVWTRLQNIRINREISKLKKIENKVNLENGKMKIEWANLTSPQTLSEMAQSKFALKRPKPSQIIFLNENKD